jgi:deoxycytidylate deaminase
MTDSIQKIKFPELVFGFVAPIGADLTTTVAAFRSYFEHRSYRVVEIKVTEIFNVLQKYIAPDVPLDKSSLHRRYVTYIAYGDQLRAKFDDAILAATSIRRVMSKRLKIARTTEERFSRIVFLIHQFKRKEEIDLLRNVYGRLFFQVSIYSRRGARVDYLSRKFASSDHATGHLKYRHAAEELIQVDEDEVGKLHGQRVAKIFHDADFIANIDATENIETQVNRFCELIFGSNSISPTRTEYGLFLAKAAALRTLDLSRQVGAAIFTPSGEIISLGSNEVPRAGGGTYWPEDKFDDRDFKRKYDSNFQRKREILAQLMEVIGSAKSIDDALSDPKIQDSQFMDALEYGRVVHAEMSALADAARLGNSVIGGTLFCTTFPCHLCAKQIIAAGVAKVVFLEPYPKSLASDLHADAICVEGGDRGHYQAYPSVEFEHFCGVTPRRYREIFERGKRKKDQDGSFVEYMNNEPSPIIDIKYPFYHQLEEFITVRAMKALHDYASDDEIASI